MTTKMPSKKQYNLVHDDAYDSRIPLHSEQAFQQGIQFQAKFIGSLDVPRPSSRVEIVAAMRRIRYDFKAKGIEKKEVNIMVSVDGVKVTIRRKKKKHQFWDESKLVIMHHPIYRIFYVSHDSQDLKIFSYIARDCSSNAFKCSVFKSCKKSQAMKIVRTVGQAFEVCHKLSHQFSGEGTTGHSPQSKLTNHVMDSSQGDDDYRINESIKANLNKNPKLSVDGSIVPATSCDTMTEEILIQETALPSGDRDNESSPVKIDRNSPRHTKNHNQGFNPVASTNSSPNAVANASINVAQSHSSNCSTESTLTRRHQLQLMKEQLDQQQQQTQAAVVQVHLLRDQLAAEMQARVDVQARNEQLLVQNRQLLEHLQTLVNQLHMLEAKINLNSPQCQNGGGDFSNQHEILSQRSQDSDTSRQNVSQLSSLDLPNIQSLLHNSPIQQQSAAALQQHLLSRQIQTGQSSFSFDPNFQLSQLYGNITSTPLSNIPQSKSLQHFQMPNNTHSQAYLQNGGMGLWSPIRDLSGNSPYQLRTSYNVPVSAKSDFAMPTPKLDPPPPSKNKQSRSPQMIASPETDAPKSSSSNNSLSSIESARQKGGSFNPEQGQIRGGSLKERSANMPSFRQIQLPSILQQTQALMDLNYDFEESSSWNLGDGGGQQSEELSDSEQTRLNRSAWQRHTVGK